MFKILKNNLIIKKLRNNMKEILNQYIKIKFKNKEYKIYEKKEKSSNKIIFGTKIIGKNKYNENLIETIYLFLIIKLDKENNINYKIKIVDKINLDNLNVEEEKVDNEIKNLLEKLKKIN